MISNLMEYLNNKHIPKSDVFDDKLIRHMSLQSILSIKKKYSEKYGKIVICCDNYHYWRKDIFPYYKAHRKADREKSKHDWNFIFTTLNKIEGELREHFPYKILNVEGAEADDIIGVLCSRVMENVLIVSSDKDFMQLQKYSNVSQYSPRMKKFLKTSNPTKFLMEHIIRGDKGDGIPNFLSEDDSIVTNTRQRNINTQYLEEWLKQVPEKFCKTEDMLRRYYRNKTLIDLDMIPEVIKENIINEYAAWNEKPFSRSNLLNFFVNNNLRSLTENIGDF